MLYRLTVHEEIDDALLGQIYFRGKPIDLEYHRAATVDEAVDLLDRFGNEARIIAGGTDLLGLIKHKIVLPRVLVDVTPISSIKQIVRTAEGLSIGALALIRDLEYSSLIQEESPILFDAARSIASPQIRNMATLGGNLCQETRCWYYRRSPLTGNTFDCARKSAEGECYAREGENQYHAIIGDSPCVSVNPSDMATVLLALDARIKTTGPGGQRVVSVDDFYTDVGNTLEHGEIITALQVSESVVGTRQRFLKFRLRKAIDFAIVSVAAVVTVDRGIVHDARIVVGGVAQKPFRATHAEQVVVGERLTAATAAEAARASMIAAAPLSKNGYKVPIAEALIKRALLE
jgi:xanthine dehydrogenase YagS FAD-binding subunit